MSLNDPTIWSAILLVCLLALLVEEAAIFRILFATHAAPHRYLLLLLPFTVAIWSFAVLWHALNVAMYPSYYIGTHLSFALWQMLRASIDQTIIACQVQAVITLAVFGVLLFIERRMLPQVEREAAWVVARERIIRR